MAFAKKMSFNKKHLLILISLIYFAINLFFISKESYIFSLLPLIILVVYLYLFSLDTVFFIAVALTPLSFELRNEEMNLAISLPVEPLLFGILIIFLFNLLLNNPFDKNFLRNGVTLFVLFHLLWMFVTSVTSQIPIVSFKYFLMQLWFIVPVYFFGSLILKEKKQIYKFFFLLIISIAITVIYTTVNHYIHFFQEKAGNWVMQPFYNDHTAYGAVLALILPASLLITFKSSFSKAVKFFTFIASLLFLLGLFLSFSRAAWISSLGALFFYILLTNKIKFRYIAIVTAFIMVILYVNFDTLMMKLEKNRQDSSKHFVEHVQSIANISTDASNLERINRWNSAIRMFKEYPFFGVGSGTYQFLYAPYQHSKDRTIISTNAGNLGNAHSEYLTPLTERGVLGLVLFLGIVASTFFYGIKAYQRTNDKDKKIIISATLTGLTSYLIHGFLNNFLDKHYASVIFWGFILMNVLLYIETKHEKTDNYETT